MAEGIGGQHQIAPTVIFTVAAAGEAEVSAMTPEFTGGSQPPQNRTAFMPHISSTLPYSPSQKSAKLIELYSVW